MKASVAALVAISSLVLAACGSDDDNFKWTAEKNVSNRLKDPDSAKFKGTYIIRQPPEGKLEISQVVACGYVDGKNSFGAYTGGTRFVVRGIQGANLQDITFIEMDDPTDQRATARSRRSDKPATIFEEVYWNVYCVDSSHRPTYTARID